MGKKVRKIEELEELEELEEIEEIDEAEEEEKVVPLKKKKAKKTKKSKKSKKSELEYDMRISVADRVAKLFLKESVEIGDREIWFVGRQAVDIPVWSLYYLLRNKVPVAIQSTVHVAVKSEDDDLNEGIHYNKGYMLTVWLKEEHLELPEIIAVFPKLIGDYKRIMALVEKANEDEEGWE